MRAIAAIAAVTAACGGAAKAPATTPAPATQDELVQTRATPPPVLAWTDGTGGKLEVRGLPAVAAAGEVVVLAVTDGDATRIEVRGADDHVVRTIGVSTGAAGPTGTGEVDAVNRELAILHGVHDLRPLHELAVEAEHGGEDQHWATGDNLDIEWRDHHLRVFRHNSTQPLVDRDGARWASGAATATCIAPAFLGAVYHATPGTTLDAAGNTIVVAIAYRGSDACHAPAAQLHVISWVGAR